MKDILIRLKKYAKPLTAAFVMLVLSTVCSVTLPTLMTNIVDYGINAKNPGYVYRTCAAMAAVAVADVLLVVFAYKISLNAVQDFCRDLRAEIFRKVNFMPLDEVKKAGTGALITRSIEDVDRVGEVIITLMSALSAIPFTTVAGTLLAFRKDWALALILFAFVPLLLCVVLLASRKIHPLWKISDEYVDKQNALIRSRLTGIRVVRAFNREGAEQQKIDKATHVMADNIIRANIRMGLIGPVCLLVLNLVTVLIVYVGASRLTLPGSRLTPGGILAVIEYVGMIMSGIMSVSFSVSEIPRARVNCARIGEVLSANAIGEETDEADTSVSHLPPFKGGITLKNVRYRYAGGAADALDGIDMEIAAGERTAIIGGTGSGKSTVVRLILALNAPTDGEIFFDGVPVSAIPERRVRENVSCVLQKDAVFSGTIRENVAAGRQVSDEEIQSALEDARLADFVRAQKEGADYPVTQRGGNLSGGQKQRLTIARAILKPAAAYIFDDSFSALDFMTESEVRARLAVRLKGKTQVIVTQRAATAMTCDRIYVLDGGKVVAHGTHEELLRSCAIYREIYLSQTR